MKFDLLVENISSIHEVLQSQASHAVNLALTARNWLVGCYIVEYEQKGEDRSAYGEKLLKNLELRLKTKGLTERRFREFRRLYLVYPQLQSEVIKYLFENPSVGASLEHSAPEIRRIASAESGDSIRRMSSAESVSEKWMLPPDMLFKRLPYSNLIVIAQIDNPAKRAFYELEAIKGCWSNKELGRQIHSLYYERSGLSQDKEKLSAMVQQQAVALQPKDILHTPVALEFLGLEAKEVVLESDLEKAIIDHLQEFLLEMGTGFCFEARQKRILVDSDYFKADLVFYHRILKCHVIVEVKVDRFRHEYASQLNTYLNYYKNEVMQPDDNPPIGILLCTDKGDTLVKYATAGLDQNIFVQKYLVNLPSEDDIKTFIANGLL